MAEFATGNLTGKGGDMFRIGPLKLLGDGALGSRTAHLSKPYLNDPENNQDGYLAFVLEKCAPTFGYYGRFGDEADLWTLAL